MSNTTFGTGNVINVAATNSIAGGNTNTILAGDSNFVMGHTLTIEAGDNNTAFGIGNTITGGVNNFVTGSNNGPVTGFQSFVAGDGNQTTASRAGQFITGFDGIFMYNTATAFATDTFNYSNQLAGGNDATPSLYPGEGISQFEKTIANGIYPLGQQSAYVNTGDGLNYAIMLQGKLGLKVGTFVTITCKKSGSQRLIGKAACTQDVIGVINGGNGAFVANAGQFPASERIQYDIFKDPKININAPGFTSNFNFNAQVTSGTGSAGPVDQILPQIIYPVIPSGVSVSFPGYLTALRPSVDRAVPFVPYDQRSTYYQIALKGLVVVRAACDCKQALKCDVECGKAVPGTTYFIIQYIDKHHLLILL